MLVDWITTDLPLYPRKGPEAMVVMMESGPDWSRFDFGPEDAVFRMKAVVLDPEEWDQVYDALLRTNTLEYLLLQGGMEIDQGSYEDVQPQRVSKCVPIFREAAKRLPLGLPRQWAHAVADLAQEAQRRGSGLGFIM